MITFLLAIVLVIFLFLVSQTVRSLIQRVRDLEREMVALKREIARRREEPASMEPVRIEPQPIPPVAARHDEPVVAGTRPIEPATVQPVAGEGVLSSLPRRPPASGARGVGEESLETRIGGRWLLYVGTLAILVAVSYFIKYAIDSRWLTERARVVLGGLSGIALILAGRRFRQKSYAAYGAVLAGGGIAVLYVSVYAAFGFYRILTRAPSFALMAIVTATAAWLADRWRSLALAIIAIGGGFTTPFLLGSDRDAQIALFTYDAILVLAVIVLARRRAWPQLNALSFGFIVLTFLNWGGRFYTDAKFLTTEFFLTLFCGMFLWILKDNRRLTHPLAPLVTTLLYWAPVLYHVSSVYILFNHPIALLVYFLAFTLAAIVVAVETNASWLRPAAWLAVGLPLGAWLGSARQPLVPMIVILSAIYLIHLTSQLDLVWRGRQRFDIADAALFHANPFGFFAALHFALAPRYPEYMGALAAGFALGYLVLARTLRGVERLASLLAVGVAVAFIAIAIPLQLEGPWVTIGWTTEAVVLVWIGLRTDFPIMRAAGLALLGFATLRVLSIHFDIPPAEFEPFWNARVATAGYLIGALYIVAAIYQRLGRTAHERSKTAIAVTVLAANIVTVLLLSAELDSYWDDRVTVVSNASLMKHLSLSVSWAIYSILLTLTGIKRRYAPIRYLAIGLFAVTIFKVFTIDLAALDRFYRIVSLVVLGVVLLVAAYMYQRFQKGIIQGSDLES